jgi:hypothetical protein
VFETPLTLSLPLYGSFGCRSLRGVDWILHTATEVPHSSAVHLWRGTEDFSSYLNSSYLFFHRCVSAIQSYGGKYIPAICYKIHQMNSSPNVSFVASHSPFHCHFHFTLLSLSLSSIDPFLTKMDPSERFRYWRWLDAPSRPEWYLHMNVQLNLGLTLHAQIIPLPRT